MTCDYLVKMGVPTHMPKSMLAFSKILKGTRISADTIILLEQAAENSAPGLCRLYLSWCGYVLPEPDVDCS